MSQGKQRFQRPLRGRVVVCRNDVGTPSEGIIASHRIMWRQDDRAFCVDYTDDTTIRPLGFDNREVRAEVCREQQGEARCDPCRYFGPLRLGLDFHVGIVATTHLSCQRDFGPAPGFGLAVATSARIAARICSGRSCHASTIRARSGSVAAEFAGSVSGVPDQFSSPSAPDFALFSDPTSEFSEQSADCSSPSGGNHSGRCRVCAGPFEPGVRV